MSSLKTTNLNMHKWVATDPVQRTEFNDNFDKIDEHAQSVTAQLADISYSVNDKTTEQIQQAINDYRTVFFPNTDTNVYTLTNTLKIPSNTTIIIAVGEF